MRSTGALLVLVLFTSSSTFGQGGAPGQMSQPGQPAQPAPPGPNNPQRMPARPLRPGETPPKGTAVLRGQVTMSGTGAPVRRVQIRAQAMDARGGGGVTTTDNNGLYEIRNLPAGRYAINAQKGGFAQMAFGQRRPGDPGTPIELADGQTADKVNFVLTRGGVIAGTIVDDGGDPIASAQVSALRYQFIAGSRRLTTPPADGASDRTDDRGQFRLFGLPPGEYYVSGNNTNFRFMPPGAINTEQDGFAPTYYPGTPNVAEATRISLKAGQEMSGANFALIVARMARVRGRVLTSRGEPAAGSMAMLTPAEPYSGMAMMTIVNAVVDADGNFNFANVAPGRYNLNIRPSGGMQNPNGEFAVMPLTIANDDLDNVLVTTHGGATVRGVVTTDDGSPPPFRPDQVQVFAQMTEPTSMMLNPAMNRIHDDYAFEITGLSGSRRFTASVGAGMPAGWYLKSVLYDDQDISDSGMTFEPGRSYEGVTVVFSQKATDLSGVLTDDRNQPVIDATVVIFPANRERWGFLSRYVRTLRPDQNGRFTIRNLPPSDDYLIIAVQNLEQGQGSDPEFLTRARDEAKAFSLSEAETKVIDIKLSALVP